MRASSREMVTTGALMNSFNRVWICWARALGVSPTAVTSLRKGIDTLPSSRTRTRADMSGWLKTLT